MKYGIFLIFAVVLYAALPAAADPVQLQPPGTIQTNRFICPLCHGEKIIPCYACKGTGRHECFRCSGTGIIISSNAQTNRSGVTYLYRTNTCPVCHGERDVQCEQCRGSGIIPCYNCSGKGYREYIISYPAAPPPYNASEQGGFRSTRWGMTRGQLRNIVSCTDYYFYFNTLHYTRHRDAIQCDDIINGNDGKFFYIFRNDRLSQVWIYLRRIGHRRSPSIYNEFYDLFSERYGLPVRVVYNQEDGHHTVWITSTTIIELRLNFTEAINGDILTLTYTKRVPTIFFQFGTKLEYTGITPAYDDL